MFDQKRAIKNGMFIVMLTCIFFSGCGERNVENYGLNPDKPVTINVWTYYNSNSKTAFDSLTDEFNKTVGREIGITVNAFSTGGVSELNELINAELAKNEDERNLPDLFGCYMDTAWDVEKEGLLVDLSDYFTEEELDEYVEQYISDGYIAGKLKVLPVAKSTEIFAVNKTEWDKFSQASGIGEDAFFTWEGITKTAKAYYEWTDSLTEEPNDGKAFFGRDSMANYMIVGSHQLGTDIFSQDDGRINIQLNREVMKKIWDNHYVPYISGYFGRYGRFRSDDIQLGKIIAMTGSSTSSAFLPVEVTNEDGTSTPVEIKIYSLPNFEGTDACAVQQGAGMAISKSDQIHEYASAVFLKWFTSKEQNVSFTIDSSYLPVKTSANSYDYIKEQVQKGGMEWSNIIENTVDISLNQVKDYKLYNSAPFDNSLQARNILENNLSDLAIQDREKVVSLLEQGFQLEDAVGQLNTEQHFEEWLRGLENTLMSVIQKQ